MNYLQLIAVLLFFLFLFWIAWALFVKSDEGPTYYTIDGGNLCPFPDMTDEQLYDYEADPFIRIKPENRTWPTLGDYLDYCRARDAKKENSNG